MNFYLLAVAAIILLCVLLNKVTQRLGVPMLLAFIALGMFFGVDGIIGVEFNNYRLSEQVCSVALVFIMFYGGFGTSWKQARPIAFKAGLLASAGVLLTATLVGLFCILALGMDILDGLLLGAVLSSTDAASVFSVLRSKKLGLKENTASLLEVESGSNDPCSYMLTIIILTLMSGQTGDRLVWMVGAQLLFGILGGFLIAWGAKFVLQHLRTMTPGFDMALVLGIAVLSYALPLAFGGNGYLSAYITGILLGNSPIRNKRSLVNFFDGFTSLMQMLIFFLLGLLATPSDIWPILVPALLLALFLTFVARPIAVAVCLFPFRGSINQMLLVSFAGLRGAASIVFAVMATVHEAATQSNLFHIVFCVVLLSIAFQGSLLAPMARRLGMCDQSVDDSKSFSDYTEEVPLNFIRLELYPRHPWVGKALREITLPPDMLVVMLLREGLNIWPSGITDLQQGDTLILSALAYVGKDSLALRELPITEGSPWIGKTIAEFSPHPDELIVMILRAEQAVIPRGESVIVIDDILVMAAQGENIGI